MIKTFTTSPLTYQFEESDSDHIISVQNNATYDFSHAEQTNDGLIELSIPAYQDYVPQIIPDCAFKNCADLSVVEGLSVKTIGNQTFNWCDQLKVVRIPQVTKIGNAAFTNCNLSVLVLSDATKVTEIETNSLIRNFRRPISVYIPDSLLDSWIDKDSNNNWKYILSGIDKVEDRDYQILILSSDNSDSYNNTVKNLLLTTSISANSVKTVWNNVYPGILSNFACLANTLSVFRYTYSDSSSGKFSDEQLEYLEDALTGQSDDTRLSDIIEKCDLNTETKYVGISSNTDYQYITNLQKITQFPLYDTSALNIYERFRPLSSSVGIMSSKVDIDIPVNNIYRNTRNTVAELDDIFMPLSTFGHYLSSGSEISTKLLSASYLNTVNTAIVWFQHTQSAFKELIK